MWIGGNVVILSGVNIGDGAVIANNSHVITPFNISNADYLSIIKMEFQ